MVDLCLLRLPDLYLPDDISESAALVEYLGSPLVCFLLYSPMYPVVSEPESLSKTGFHRAQSLAGAE